MSGPGWKRLGLALLRELSLLGPHQGRMVLGLGLWGVCSSSPQAARAPVSLHLVCPQVYDTPPMAVKGPNGRDPSLDVYDVPPSVEKGLPPSSHRAVSSRGVPGPHGLRQDSARFCL